MGQNTSFVDGTPDDEFTSDAAQAAIAAAEFQAAAEAAAAAAEAALAATLAALADYLPLAGGTMTGAIVLAGAPTVDLNPATKKYVDDADALALPLAGGTMTGKIFLDSDPTALLHAATKQYVDAQVGEYDIPFYFEGLGTDGFEQIMFMVVGTPFTLPEDLTGSQGYALTAPDAATDYDITKNDVSIGTISFAGGSNTATFTFAADVSFAAGDRLEVLGPEYADIYLADFSINLVATKD